MASWNPRGHPETADQHGALLHAGFFLGSEEFYVWLRELPDAKRDLSRCAASPSSTFFTARRHKRPDRVDARFVNSAMMTTLLGETVSDTLEDGRVVSGAGGHYNFVAQAFALDRALGDHVERDPQSQGQAPLAHRFALRPHHHPAVSARHFHHGIWH